MSESTEMRELASCPFCGGGATVEEIGSGDRVRFSVGCIDEGGECYGYQSLTSFGRRCEAIAAWNRRSPPVDREAVAKIVYAAMWPDNSPAVPWEHIENVMAKAPVLQAADEILRLLQPEAKAE